MPKRISVAEHLSVEDLEQHYRQAKTGINSRQFHILWLLAKGKTTEEVVDLSGYSRDWIYKLVRRYSKQGASTLGDQRRHNPGATLLLDDEQQAQLWQVLQGPAPDGGLWNGRKVAEWLSELTGEHIYRQRGREILRQMSLRLRVPRPAHTEANLEEHGSVPGEDSSGHLPQQAWKKT